MRDMEFVWVAILAGLVAACGPGTAGATAYPVIWDEEEYGMKASPPPKAEDWARWMAQPWESGGDPRTFTVYDGERREVPVGSCEELFQADERGWAADSLQGRILRAWASTCYGARAIAAAMPAAQSHVEGLVLDEVTVRSLPPAMGFVISRDDERKVAQLEAEGGTLGDYIGGAGVVLGEDGGATISDEWGGHQSLKVRANGDFNRDGVADLLVSTSSWVEGGSYWSQQLWIITRDEPGAPLRMLEEIRVMGP